MAKTMTPSSITDGQIDKAGNDLRAVFCKRLREHRAEFDSDVTQKVLGDPALGPKLMAVFRQMYEAVSNMIVRHVKNVKRDHAPQEMLDALGRRQYTDRDVVSTMPRGEGGEGDVYFLPVNRNISDDDMEKEYQSDGWVAADPYLVAAANKEDPELADEHPNFTHWKDSEGRWCYLACRRDGDQRFVAVGRRARGWLAYWFVAVVRKKSLDS